MTMVIPMLLNGGDIMKKIFIAALACSLLCACTPSPSTETGSLNRYSITKMDEQNQYLITYEEDGILYYQIMLVSTDNELISTGEGWSAVSPPEE